MERTHCDICDAVMSPLSSEIKTSLCNGGKNAVVNITIGYHHRDEFSGTKFRPWDVCRPCRAKVLAEAARYEATHGNWIMDGRTWDEVPEVAVE